MMMVANDVPSPAFIPSAPTMDDEINHRVSNHLQLLAALINVEGRNVSDLHSKGVLERTQQRLRAIGGVHRHLYMGGGGEVDLGAYLEELGEQLTLSCPAYRRIVVDAQSVPVPGRTATSVGILATELVTNACKHAYAADEPGAILVGLRRLPGGDHRFVVEDRGSGAGGASAGTGFGSRLIEATVKTLGGAAVVGNLRPGTRFEMTVRFGLPCR